jgi:hypothetical protein
MATHPGRYDHFMSEEYQRLPPLPPGEMTSILESIQAVRSFQSSSFDTTVSPIKKSRATASFGGAGSSASPSKKVSIATPLSGTVPVVIPINNGSAVAPFNGMVPIASPMKQVSAAAAAAASDQSASAPTMITKGPTDATRSTNTLRKPLNHMVASKRTRKRSCSFTHAEIATLSNYPVATLPNRLLAVLRCPECGKIACPVIYLYQTCY